MKNDLEFELNGLEQMLNLGQFSEAYAEANGLLNKLMKNQMPNSSYHICLFHLAGIFIDIGQMQPNRKSVEIGVCLLEDHADMIKESCSISRFFYFLANGKSYLLKNSGIRSSEDEAFKVSAIQQVGEVISLYWYSMEQSRKEHGAESLDIKVNLANCLRGQYRVVEALFFYDQVNYAGLDIPQSWVNRSEALQTLSQMSDSMSIEMVRQGRKGYEKVLNSREIPPQWRSVYREKINKHNIIIEEHGGIPYGDAHEEMETEKEFKALSPYRRWCIEHQFALSEHALYCKCVAADSDNLTIIPSSGVCGEFIPAMEAVLNRLKSEFSFATLLLYEFCHVEKFSQSETPFSELFNQELLGVDVEKIRTSFRLCFGILDKIAIAVSKVFNLEPVKGNTYFQSFWNLKNEHRREIFEKANNKGLIALYGVASDLNFSVGGQLSLYKQWRNYLEHSFLVVYRGEDTPQDLYGTYTFLPDVLYVQEDNFVSSLKHLLQLTRASIFYFTFAIREEGLKLAKVNIDSVRPTITVDWM
ncbi:MAG: hypothetical protein KGO49_14025 [Gammaproteobacteria bacterium]|nr:hypothetical protein [Gammaproteobacteria bacterium]